MLVMVTTTDRRIETVTPSRQPDAVRPVLADALNTLADLSKSQTARVMLAGVYLLPYVSTM
jgi:hypothetical protein